MLQKYLHADKNVRYLLLVSRTPPTLSAKKTIEALRTNNSVSVLTVPKEVDAKPLLEQAVRNAELGVGRA